MATEPTAEEIGKALDVLLAGLEAAKKTKADYKEMMLTMCPSADAEKSWHENTANDNNIIMARLILAFATLKFSTGVLVALDDFRKETQESLVA